MAALPKVGGILHDQKGNFGALGMRGRAHEVGPYDHHTSLSSTLPFRGLIATVRCMDWVRSLSLGAARDVASASSDSQPTAEVPLSSLSELRLVDLH